MFRKSLIPLLLRQPMTVSEIARLADQSDKDTASDIEHLLQSLKHTEYKAMIEPASCRKCGFTFGSDKLRKPSRCPECKSSWVSEPRLQLELR